MLPIIFFWLVGKKWAQSNLIQTETTEKAVETSNNSVRSVSSLTDDLEPSIDYLSRFSTVTTPEKTSGTREDPVVLSASLVTNNLKPATPVSKEQTKLVSDSNIADRGYRKRATENENCLPSNSSASELIAGGTLNEQKLETDHQSLAQKCDVTFNGCIKPVMSDARITTTNNNNNANYNLDDARSFSSIDSTAALSESKIVDVEKSPTEEIFTEKREDDDLEDDDRLEKVLALLKEIGQILVEIKNMLMLIESSARIFSLERRELENRLQAQDFVIADLKSRLSMCAPNEGH